KDRMPVMRKLAEVDFVNPMWGEDLRTFEKARFQQMEAEADQAATRHDVVALAQLQQEIAQTGWLAEPPAVLTCKLEQRLEQGQLVQARDRLRQLAPALNGAYSALDVAEGMQ